MLQAAGLGRSSTWAPGAVPSQQLWQQQWSPEMLAELYYNWSALAGAPANSAAVAADTEAGGSAGRAATAGDWCSVVQAAAAAASQWEIQKLSVAQQHAAGEEQGLRTMCCAWPFNCTPVHPLHLRRPTEVDWKPGLCPAVHTLLQGLIHLKCGAEDCDGSSGVVREVELCHACRWIAGSPCCRHCAERSTGCAIWIPWIARARTLEQGLPRFVAYTGHCSPFTC
jgi:hypothetical protein